MRCKIEASAASSDEKAVAPKPETDGLPPIEWGNVLGALDDIERSNGEREWIVEGVIEGSPLVVFIGPEKKWKSWIGVDLTVAMTTGGRWLGEFPVRKPGDVVVIDVEYGVKEWARRMKRVAAARGVDPRAVEQRLRYFDGRFGFALHAQCPEYLQLIDYVQEHPPSLIIIDPLRNVLDGDEDKAADIIAAMRFLNKLRCLGKCPLLVAHHLNKGGKMAGSRAIRGRADLLFDGTDKPVPWYTAIGRTIRDGDPIARPFSVSVVHEDDDDDRIAKTTVGLTSSNKDRITTDKPERTNDEGDDHDLERVRQAIDDAGATGATSNAIAEATELKDKAVRKHTSALVEAGIAIEQDAIIRGRKRRIFILRDHLSRSSSER